MNCIKCHRCLFRRNVVIGEGDPNADIVIIDQSPRYSSDKYSKVLIGNVGKFLNKYLDYFNLKRDEIYITYAVKCRGDMDAYPSRVEMIECNEHLINELRSIKPKLVIMLGAIATKSTYKDSDLTLHSVIGKLFKNDSNTLLMSTHGIMSAINDPKLAEEMYLHIKLAVDEYEIVNPFHRYDKYNNLNFLNK